MKTTLIIILCALLSISASVVTSTVVSQPAKPKAVFVENLWGAGQAQETIETKYKQGYILKSASTYGNYCLVVMEKY